MDNSTAENYAEQAAFFAHEIKNPLAVIKANVQLIELENKSENTKSFETVYACIEKMPKRQAGKQTVTLWLSSGKLLINTRLHATGRLSLKARLRMLQ